MIKISLLIILFYLAIDRTGNVMDSSLENYLPSTLDTCFNVSTLSYCINPNKVFIENTFFIFKLPGNCYNNIISFQMCLFVNISVDFEMPLVRLLFYTQEEYTIVLNKYVNISRYDIEADVACTAILSYLLCCFKHIFKEEIQHSTQTFIGIETLQPGLRLIHSNISSNIAFCPSINESMKNFSCGACNFTSFFLLLFRIELDTESGNCLTDLIPKNSLNCPCCSEGSNTSSSTGSISTSAATQSSSSSLDLARTFSFALSVVLVALSILILSVVLIVWFVWSAKYKKRRFTFFNTTIHEILRSRNPSASSNCAVRLNKVSNAVNIGINDSSEYASPAEENEDTYIVPPFDEDAIYAQMEENSIEYLKRTDLKLENILGSGEFGEVYNGVWFSPVREMDVAVKTLKKGSSAEDRVKFLQEVAIMAQFKDSNVVTMHGVVTAGEPILLVIELLSKGDLRSYLLKTRPKENEKLIINGHTLLSFCRHVVSGMVYLSGKKFVHRDLAARNVLVSEKGICKIADFGMARNLLYESYYTSHGGMIPVKWTAPEALHYKTYATASDVWSFGVLMYEIWSVGHKPFENLKNKEVLQAIDSGYRLPPPPGCPRNIYSLMIECWHPESFKRPSFSYLKNELSLPDPILLQWSDDDESRNQEALHLGGSLTAAKNLYIDLQDIYKNSVP